MIAGANVIPEHQFGFRQNHSTVEQVSRVVSTIRTAFEHKEFCPVLFMDISQAFDRVWIEGLLHKISSYVPEQLVTLLSSYLSNWNFYVAFGNAASDTFPIRAVSWAHCCTFCILPTLQFLQRPL